MTTLSADGPTGRPADRMQRSALALTRRIGDGATGTVYEVSGGKCYYKEYLEPDVHAVRLGRLIEWRNQLSPSRRRFLDEHAAWPRSAVLDGDRTVGFLMSPAPPEFWADMLGEQDTVELQHLVHEDRSRTLGLPEVSTLSRLKLLGDLARVLQLLARDNMIYGDVNEQNVFWALRPSPRIYLIDCDNSRPADMTGADAGVAMPRDPSWRDPFLADGDPPMLASDRFALAMFCYRVCYRVMAMVEKDQDYMYVPESAPHLPDLEKLMGAGMGRPENRPPAGEWVSAVAMIDEDALRSDSATTNAGVPPPGVATAAPVTRGWLTARRATSAVLIVVVLVVILVVLLAS